MSYLNEDSWDLMKEYLEASGKYEGPEQVNRIINELAKQENSHDSSEV